MKENRSMPQAKFTPTLTYRNLPRAIEWLTRHLGFREVWRIEDHGALLSFEGGEVYVREPRLVGQSGGKASAASEGETPEETLGASCSGSIMVRLEGDPPDLASHYERIVRSGAKILQEPKDEVYGERQFVVQDVGGYHWTFSSTIKDVAPQEWGAKLAG